MAIAIPIFTSQLEKSREATDLSNVRSAYGQAISEYLSNGGEPVKIEVQAKQRIENWQSANGATNASIGVDIKTSGGSTTAAVSVPYKGSGSVYTVEVSVNGSVTVN